MRQPLARTCITMTLKGEGSMAIYRMTPDQLKPLATTSFAGEGIMERRDLQRLLRSNIEVIAPETMVIAEEYGGWIDSRRRIDLLAIDRDANLVVIELKRVDDGGHMELQALRYAAMVSTMTFEQAVDAHAQFRDAQGMDGDARESILEFLGWADVDEDLFAQDVRVVLAAAEFSTELTTAVMWLNGRDLDIRCVRMKPYLLNQDVLLDVQQIIPLPEAAEYQVQIRAKEQDQRAASGRQMERLDFWRQLLERARTKTDLHAQISPTAYSWISTGAGYTGLGWNYFVRKYDAQVELYIDTADPEQNAAIFRALHEQRSAIEADFMEELDWQALPGRRACRIRKVIPEGGFRSPPEEWTGIQDAMIDAMIRLENALARRLDDVLRTLTQRPAGGTGNGTPRLTDTSGKES